MIDRTSRYHSVPQAEHVTRDGTVMYLKRRFLPQPEPGPNDRAVIVEDGDRLDRIAARQMGDPLQFWRIADANAAMNPLDLLGAGELLLIPAIGFGGNSQ
ncbi:MAG TPA: hypothetical protein VF662_12045 [Allosphingosinicella sp.]|jgi:hypothetical protein